MFKKFLIPLLIPFIVILTSCQTMKSELQGKDKKVALKVMEIFDNGNVDELDNYVTQNSIDHQRDTTMTKKTGLAGLKEMFTKFHQIFPDMKTTIHSIAVAGDTVFVYSTSVGTSTQPFMGFPAGQKQTLNGVDVMRFKEEKIVEHWGFIDTNDMMRIVEHAMMQKNSMTGKMN